MISSMRKIPPKKRQRLHTEAQQLYSENDWRLPNGAIKDFARRHGLTHKCAGRIFQLAKRRSAHSDYQRREKASRDIKTRKFEAGQSIQDNSLSFHDAITIMAEAGVSPDDYVMFYEFWMNVRLEFKQL